MQDVAPMVAAAALMMVIMSCVALWLVAPLPLLLFASTPLLSKSASCLLSPYSSPAEGSPCAAVLDAIVASRDVAPVVVASAH